MPPVASVQIALLKNTSVAAAFGLIEAAAQMRGFTNDHADQRWGIFLAFALGFVVLVEVVSLAAGQPRAPLEDRLDVRRSPLRRPGPGPAPGTASTPCRACVALIALIALVVWRLHDAGQFAYDLWEPFVTPDYVEALWSRACSTP